MLQRLLIAVALATSVVSASATLSREIVGGKLVGASGLLVNGTSYRVTFVDGTCVAVFNGCDDPSDFAFQNQADATAASNELLSQVLLDVPEGPFDSNPALTFGCENPSTCSLIVPFGLTPQPIAMQVRNLLSSDGNGTTGFDPATDTTPILSRVFAVFEREATVAVPEPTTVSLAVLALLGIALRRHRRCVETERSLDAEVERVRRA